MTENEFRQMLDLTLQVPGTSGLIAEMCSIGSVEELIQWSGRGPLDDVGTDWLADGNHLAVNAGLGRPRPGQKAEPDSRERVYVVIQGWCRAH
jgi:hypothetical protein